MALLYGWFDYGLLACDLRFASSLFLVDCLLARREIDGFMFAEVASYI